MRRCYAPTDISYPWYGGRGIGVCTRWRDSFQAFLSDVGQKPSSSYSLDRIDNDADYSPENCRWATRDEQHRNHRRNRFLEFQGRRLCLTDWAKVIGINQASLQERLQKYPVEIALSVPRIPNGRRLSIVHEEMHGSVPD